MEYLESSVSEIMLNYPAVDIVLAGDFKKLPDDTV